MAISRRTFLQTALAGAGAAAAATPAAHAVSDYVNITRPSSLLLGGPEPKFPNIRHVVVVMMENRSADHYLGWWGEREDVRFDARTTLGAAGAGSGGIATTNWGVSGDPGFAHHRNYTGHPFADPAHGHGTGRRQMLDFDRDGIPDGWTKEGSGTDEYALSYYGAADLPVIDRIVQDFTSFDRYFNSWMGSTYPNRYYMHSAQTHGITNNDFPPQLAAEHPEWAAGFDWPTLWDFLTLRGVTWKYYFSNLPAIALFGARNLAHTRPIAEYYADCAAGTLPQVCFVDPFFVAPEGLANDDHPHADIRLGQEFYSDVTTAFMRSSCWSKGAMFINYDEWGGFWDHVVPPAVDTTVDPLSAHRPGAVPDYTDPDGAHLDGPVDFGLLGFRTPTFLLSPYARNTGANRRAGGAAAPGEPEVSADRTLSTVLDHTSILSFIAENWGLPQPGQWDPGFSRQPLHSVRDAFDPTIADPDHPGDPEVDVDAYEYVAPPEARTHALPIPASSVSDLWNAADWMDSLGFSIVTRFADALPYSR